MKLICRGLNRIFLLAVLVLYSNAELWARAGGGGGRASHDSGGGGGGGGLSFLIYLLFSHPLLLLIVIIAIAAYYFYKKKNPADIFNSGGNNEDRRPSILPSGPFPEGLDVQKVQTSFMGIQDAWQKKDLKEVRRWISDGVYQRYTAQFRMMNKLSQVNKLSNIKVSGIRLAKAAADGNYQSADVAVSFSMDDSFVSDKYPQFNENFSGDSDTEYWTFIKRNDAKKNKDLYSTDNCPNCGAPFDAKMGEISRCAGCGTLTNNASYDWVLSEITQMDDYQADDQMTQNAQLHELTKNDSLFAVQRMQDIASNVFMQIMEVFTGANQNKLSRFADKNTSENILQIKAKSEGFIFDRLYLNEATLVSFNTDPEKLNLVFRLSATYQRVKVSDQKLSLLDNEMTTHPYSLVLSKNLKSLSTPEKETVYSYECPSCGAPYNDTTNDTCNYCQAPVIDLNKNWVLTDFQMG
jgi:predicted lipid-binding transport protein (Tim44 family)/predicted RNA-binding Zn-ribbon protein involved in translation (DUF1610 family)